MISIKINGLEFLSKPGISVLEACKNVGITIPRFCYHEILSVSGNCRMCLVEIENMEKPVASCVAEVEENMSIRVDGTFVKKARENVLEALLLNHPLDCPICDQAGECDLQDQAKTFGSSHSRFFFKKKTVEDKYCGPLIKTIMTRCITCTRCVRYAEEVAGVNYFGTLNRGLNTEIGSYVQKMFESEISGNVIDLCPVGALTSKPYAFKARPWELRLSESCDTTDSLGSNVYLNYKETEILRALPKSNSDINDNLISDKARFSVDANNLNRIKNLYTFNDSKKQYEISSWENFIRNFDNTYNLTNSDVSVLINQELDLDSIVSLKELENRFLPHFKINDLDSISNNSNLYVADQQNVASQIDAIKDVSVFLGSNLRLESAILNAKVRFKFRNSYMVNLGLGASFDSNIPTKFIAVNLTQVLKIFEGRCSIFSSLLQSATKAHVFIGNGFVNRVNNVDSFKNELKNQFFNLSFIDIYSSSNSEAFKWLNIKRQPKNLNTKVVSILINSRENYLTRAAVARQASLDFFLGSHGSTLALKAKHILPTKTPFETTQKFINLEHRPQKTSQVVKCVSEARNIDTIFSSLINKELTNPNKMLWLSHITETLNNSDKFNGNLKFVNNLSFNSQFLSNATKVSKYPVKYTIKDFYLSSRLAFHSKVMRDCSKEVHKNYKNFTF